jgi:myo-inositol-1-phosphate synthase
VIVANVSSTEPPLREDLTGLSWKQLSDRLNNNDPLLPASSLYAIAAMLTECSYLNFTPSVGSNLPALEELALEQGVLHMGRDGKTGETLMKSVLAPMFAARNLKVLSWVGHNIFGNMDARVLDDPVNKASKARSKDHLLTEILGYKPQTLVSIEFIESMADWKTAWDHIHFQGFLGTPMTLQFIWQGCDSLLAAPLVLDLVRFTEREWRRGTSGVMTHLASFFKSPMGENVPPEFGRQFEGLLEWAREAGGGPGVSG